MTEQVMIRKVKTKYVAQCPYCGFINDENVKFVMECKFCKNEFSSIIDIKEVFPNDRV